MTSATLTQMQTLGEDYEGEGLIEILGPAPCPVEGCKNDGQRVRLLRLVITNPCAECGAKLEAEREEEERRERVERLLDRAGRTPRLGAFSLDTYPDDEEGRATRRVVEDWIEKIATATKETPAPNLFMHGGIGGGKTGVMWGAVRALCEREIEARLVDFPGLLEQIKVSYSKNVPFDDYSDLMRVPVLVIDDVGAERPTEWACGQLLQIVNRRYERCLPTAYVSNYTPDLLMQRLGRDDKIIGDRIVSRMMEGAMRHRNKADDRRLT